MGRKKKALPSRANTSQHKVENTSKEFIDRRSVVRISDTAELKIKHLLQTVSYVEPLLKDWTTSFTRKKAARRLFSIYTQLKEYGFQASKIEDAILHLPQKCASLDLTLDWLMLTIPSTELPRSFTNYSGVFSTKNIIEVIKTSNPQIKSSPTDRVSTGVEQDSSLVPVKKKQEEVQESVNAKEWILQYLEQSSNEAHSDEDEALVGSDEWEVWSDPREVDRRRQDRNSGQYTDIQKITLVSQELDRVKNQATIAKASRDFTTQKKTGVIIQQLKIELEQLGASKCLLNPVVPEAMDPKQEEESSSEESLFGDGFFQEAESPSLPAESSKKESNEEFCNLAEVLFNVEPPLESEEDSLSTLFEDKPKLEISKPVNTVSNQSFNLVLERWRKSHVPIKLENHRLPKTLLLQNCQKMKWSNPKFDRIKGSSLYVQSVAINIQQRKKKNIGIENGKHEFVFPFDYEPESLQEGQNCVAIVALMKLFPHLKLELILQQPYKDIYFQIQQNKDELDSTDTLQIEQFVQGALVQLGFNLDEEQVPVEAEEDKSPQEQSDHTINPQNKNFNFLRRNSRIDNKLARDLESFWSSRTGQNWLEERASLPVHSIRSDLLQACQHHHLLLISGDTGCGKTTQIPQFIFEDSVLTKFGSTCNILVTQPRRLAAISVSHRVADEMGQNRPSSEASSSSLVGYHVRLNSAITKQTRITFCTTGILLRILSGDKYLSGYSHVIVDEVHERSMQSDFLIAVLKDLVGIREQLGHPLKVILMSATMDSDLFANYLHCPHLKTEGRTFPVTVKYLEEVYESLQYSLDPESDAAYYAGSSKNTVKESIQDKASSKSEMALLRANWGDDDVMDSDCLNKNYDPKIYESFSTVVKNNLKRLNENKIDYDLIETIIDHIDDEEPDGAILVFLPGLHEINRIYDRLVDSGRFDREWIIRLHSSLTPEEQSRAFLTPPLRSIANVRKTTRISIADLIDQERLENHSKPDRESIETNTDRRVRKIVISTNIAETSLTISDVVYVIDSGRFRERRFDSIKGISALEEDWISRASVKQRRGRAGRVSAGLCYSLYTRYRYEKLMSPYQVPEIKRIPLEETVLQTHALNLGKSGRFLEKLPQPPDSRAIEAAVKTLTDIGALESDVEVLTPLGRILATLPIDPRIGKLLILACLFRCLPAALTIAAAFGERSIFLTSAAVQEGVNLVKRRFAFGVGGGRTTLASGQQSDHLLIVAVFHGWLRLIQTGQIQKAKEYIKENQLHAPTLEIISQVRKQFKEILVEAKLTSSGGIDWDLSTTDASLIRALLCASLYPNVCTLVSPTTGTLSTNESYWSDGTSRIQIHKSCVNSHLSNGEFQYPYFVYLEKVKIRDVTVRDCTVVSPVSLLLFGGTLHVHHTDNAILIDDKIPIRAAAPIAVMFKKLRSVVDSLILQKISNPETVLDSEDPIIDTIATLLKDEEEYRKKQRV
eukprot:g6864.t1